MRGSVLHSYLWGASCRSYVIFPAHYSERFAYANMPTRNAAASAKRRRWVNAGAGEQVIARDLSLDVPIGNTRRTWASRCGPRRLTRLPVINHNTINNNHHHALVVLYADRSIGVIRGGGRGAQQCYLVVTTDAAAAAATTVLRFWNAPATRHAPANAPRRSICFERLKLRRYILHEPKVIIIQTLLPLVTT